jgi:uncharacterized protein (DUF2267 family)
MQAYEFIKRVQKLAGLESQEEAMKATEASLETLGERLTKAEREKLAAQLPKELKEYLLKRPHPDRFVLEAFYERVSARADIRYHNAVKQAQAVMAVMMEAISPGELDDILSQLSHDYSELFGQKPESPLSPSV